MEIRFVNHASFVCEVRGVQILCDPWLEGSAFNGGWDLVAPTRFGARDFEQIDYVWLSHEHPDHFSPAALNRVPEALRPRIVVLYQQTSDQKVLDYCKQLGFGTRELADGAPLELAPGVEILCRRVPLHDSWLALRTPEGTLLNLNDAVVHTPAALARIKRELGAIDVLFTQFNYAAWRGNREDTELRRADALKKLELMRRQVEVLQPRYTVPFASFSYFSHIENSFINDGANEPRHALAVLALTASKPILLYPGDRWTLGDAHDNERAEARYREDYARSSVRTPRLSPSVSPVELEQAALGYIARVRSNNDRRVLALLRHLPALGLLGPIEIFLWDYARTLRFSFEHGLELVDAPSAQYDLAMGSDSLHFLLKYPWGVDTLTVNGRFSACRRGLRQLIMTFGVDALNNAGFRLGASLLVDLGTLRFLGRVLAQKLWSLRKQQRRTRTEVVGAPARPSQAAPRPRRQGAVSLAAP
jgi:UDP-MurNAc hydroxylase